MTTEQKQEASGKGKSRVMIATEVRDKAVEKLAGCEKRLIEAIEAEKVGKAKKQEKEKGKKERAKRALEALGWTEARIAKAGI